MSINGEPKKCTREQALDLYPILRELPFSPKEIQKLSIEDVLTHCQTSSGKIVDHKSFDLRGTDPNQATAALRCAIAVSKNYSEEQFVDFLVNENVPPVELTAHDMEQLKGGWFWWVVAVWSLVVDLKAGYEAYHS